MSEAVILTQKYTTCPSCRESWHRVDYIKDGFSSLWYCDNKECGSRFRIECRSGTIYTEPTGEFAQRYISALRLGTLYFFVDGIWSEYSLREGTCPTNFLPDVVDIYDARQDEFDPHGCFEFIKQIPRPPNFDPRNNEQAAYSELMPLAVRRE